MFSRRRLPLVLAGFALLAISGIAAAAPEANTYSASSTPTQVRRATQASYTVTLTNSAGSEREADRARIVIPAGFSVDEASVSGSSSASGECVSSQWDREINDGRISLSRSGGPGNTRLCPGATLTISLNATSAAADGSYTWVTELVRDDEGFAISGAQPTVTVDGAAPTVAITGKPADPSNSRGAALTFAVSEPAAVECKLDGAAFAPCSSPAAYSNLPDGAHTFSVRATDQLGNAAVASYGWSVDATAPDTTIVTGPRARTTALSATFTFTASEQGAFECKLDGEAFTPCASPKRYSGLRRAAHNFEVRSIDRAGNVDASPAARRWTIGGVRRATKSTSALFRPQAGARVSAPPLLAWRRVPRASYYNLQLYRGRVKVLSTWPTRTRIQLRSRWTYLGRQRRLLPGAYRWYVWPGYGPARAHRYGALLGQSRFTVTR